MKYNQSIPAPIICIQKPSML